jgi:hypothetical protein
VSQQLTPYLKRFGLKQGAPFHQVTARYYAAVEKFPGVPTAEQEGERRRLDHTYEILKMAYKTSAPAARAMVRNRRRSSTTLRVGLGVAAVLLVGTAIVLAMNFSALKMKMTGYDAGDVVCWKETGKTYGKVIEFEPAHRFPVGQPSAAYLIQLEETTETVWISERVVEGAMTVVN